MKSERRKKRQQESESGQKSVWTVVYPHQVRLYLPAYKTAVKPAYFRYLYPIIIAWFVFSAHTISCITLEKQPCCSVILCFTSLSPATMKWSHSHLTYGWLKHWENLCISFSSPFTEVTRFHLWQLLHTRLRICLTWYHRLTIFYSTHSMWGKITAGVGQDLQEVMPCLQQKRKAL